MYTQPTNDRIENFFESAATTSLERRIQDGDPFLPITGQHIYGNLRLNNDLEQPTNTQRARQLLEVYDLYFKCAEKAAERTGAQLLEMQGNVIHVILPSIDPNHWQVLAFCKAFSEGVEKTVKPKAGESFQGFSMASYHGPAVIVRGNAFGTISEVSLGVAANRPAKKLLGTPGVPTRHVAIPAHQVIGNKLTSGWIEFDLTQDQSDAIGRNKTLFESVASAFDSGPIEPPIFEFEARRFESGLNAPTTRPVQTFGFCLKSDMDGFSAKVEAAWATGRVRELVLEFLSVMEAANRFVENFEKPVIPAPWAGDCSTVVIQSDTILEYNTSRTVAPIKAATRWNTDVSVGGTYSKGVKWAHAVAGGDVGNASNGNIIVAALEGKRRKFPIIVGACVNIARDGEQADGLHGGELAIYRPSDLNRLLQPYRAHFVEFTNSKLQTNTHFKKANCTALANTYRAESTSSVSAIAAVGTSSTVSSRIQIPTPKVYCKTS